MERLICKKNFVYLANLDPVTGSEMGKTRPVVIISPTNMNEALKTVVICPLTTSLRPHWKTRVMTVFQEKTAEIAIDQIRTIDQSKVLKEMGALSSSAIKDISHKITHLYGAEDQTVL